MVALMMSCARKPRSACSMKSSCLTKNSETLMMKMVSTYCTPRNTMRERTDTREVVMARMELTGKLRVNFR